LYSYKSGFAFLCHWKLILQSFKFWLLKALYKIQVIKCLGSIELKVYIQVDLDSPMVVEETVTQLREQWRVPPIKDNHTVDIFTEPEYFQVLMYKNLMEYWILIHLVFYVNSN